MGWSIQNAQLVYLEKGCEIHPSAEEIYQLGQGEKTGVFATIQDSPIDVLNIRISALGASYRFNVSFDELENKIVFNILVTRGEKSALISYKNGQIPESAIINNTWYDLVEQYDDARSIIKDIGLQQDGEISLAQYIALKKRMSDCKIALNDSAEFALVNHPINISDSATPSLLRANLYPYQQRGYQWMRFVTGEGCGCILGDEMGLGKTLQIIALIASRKQTSDAPCLVIAPVSLLENWSREFKKFTSGLNVLVHHGSKRTGFYTKLQEYDVVIISYNTACSDQIILKSIKWDLLVVDEAQNIKNPTAQRTRLIKVIPRKCAIAMTGTPFENHMTDLWSLMDFILPGNFGEVSDFQSEYPDDVGGAKKLEPILSPIMIRRRVSEVAQDLPKRVDIPQILDMPEDEARMYEKAREKILANFDGKNATLPMLQKLRMFCTHPMLLEDDLKSCNPILGSEKYERLCELLEEIILLKEKTILFTSYNLMFEILKEDIAKRFGIQVMAINGSTPPEDRQPIIDKFSTIVGSALLVLNPRAAGAGLNITAASRVIHYTPEWNPSLEDQASARAYRRGQTKTVFVYRLYYKGTVEEVINDRIEKKREMFGAAIVGIDGTNENNADIMRALMISPEVQ